MVATLLVSLCFLSAGCASDVRKATAPVAPSRAVRVGIPDSVNFYLAKSGYGSFSAYNISRVETVVIAPPDTYVNFDPQTALFVDGKRIDGGVTGVIADGRADTVLGGRYAVEELPGGASKSLVARALRVSTEPTFRSMPPHGP